MFAHRISRHLTSSSLYRSLTTLMASPPKQAKMLTIGTHDGVFHCDESLACYLIKLLPEYKDAQIVRSRNQADLDKCDIVVDVGRVYDVSANRFDHHQPTFSSTLSSIFPKKNFGNIKLSSAGLIYAHFGHKIISQLMDWPKDDPRTDKLFDTVYDQFIKEIDAIDNGINMFEGEPLYHINTHLSARVAMLKPDWNEESNPQILYDRFLKAVSLTGAEFMERIRYYGKVWMPVRVLVQEAFNSRTDHHSSGRIMVLKQNMPWMQHLFELEEEHNLTGAIHYIIFPDSKDWRIRAMPVTPASFELRRKIRSEWLGLVNEDLSAKAGIEGCVFVHTTGFIGGNKTMEGALQMAIKCLE